MHSSLRDEAPEWVAYLELAESSRIYMKGLTVISPSWLTRLSPAMCDRLQPMQEPPPRYDSKADDILCVIAPLFGPHSWALPPQVWNFIFFLAVFFVCEKLLVSYCF
jgi:ATP-dependent RNA helicase DHX37/DHR1